MIASRQELDLRPQLERLDTLLLRSAGVDPATVRFGFRPLWQLSASETAAVALQKAQTTAVYAGLTLWPAATTAALVQAQLLEDGTYPNAAVAFGAGEGAAAREAAPLEARPPIADFDSEQPRDPQGRWTTGARASAAAPSDPAGAAAPPRSTSTVVATHVHEDPANNETPEDEEEKQFQEQLKELDDPIRGGPRGRPDGTVLIPLPLPAGPSIGPRMPPRLHPGQQDKHIPGTNNYDPKRSVLDHPDPQELLNRRAGTGTSANGIPAGQPGSKERVDFGEHIGQHIDKDTGVRTPTTKGMIYYSKKGAHIAPVRPEDNVDE